MAGDGWIDAHCLVTLLALLMMDFSPESLLAWIQFLGTMELIVLAKLVWESVGE